MGPKLIFWWSGLGKNNTKLNTFHFTMMYKIYVLFYQVLKKTKPVLPSVLHRCRILRLSKLMHFQTKYVAIECAADKFDSMMTLESESRIEI